MSGAGSSGGDFGIPDNFDNWSNGELEDTALSGSDISAPTKPTVTLFLHRPIYDDLDTHPIKIENGVLKVPTSPHLNQAHTISLLSLVTLDGNRKDDLDFRKYIFIDWRQNKDLKYLKNTLILIVFQNSDING